MRIGELSRRTGASPRSLRYYEQQGLLRSERSPNGYRDYPDQARATVLTIQDLFAAGLSSDVVRDVLPCLDAGGPPQNCQGDALLARVRAVREDLTRQADRIAAQTAALDRYLALAPTTSA